MLCEIDNLRRTARDVGEELAEEDATTRDRRAAKISARRSSGRCRIRLGTPLSAAQIDLVSAWIGEARGDAVGAPAAPV